MTRIVAFVNGSLGAEAVRLVAKELVAIVMHEPGKRRDEAELITATPKGVPLFTAGQDLVDALDALHPTHGISALYGHILPAPVLNLFAVGIANLHLSLLPHGRGSQPNAWAIAERQPAGVTLHLIERGVDSGAILAQRPVEIKATDNAKDLYTRLLDAGRVLLRDAVPAWLAGKLMAVGQAPGPAPRRDRDLESLRVDPDQMYTGRQLIDLLRARTFPPYPGALYEVDGKKLRVRIEIEEEKS